MHDNSNGAASDAAINSPQRPRIVVIGGGFGGINFIQQIDKSKFDVTIIDRNNYHCFPPLFYQVASGGLEPGSISFPFRREIRRRKVKGVKYRMGEVTAIDFAAKTVVTDDGSVDYDHLVIAIGTTNNFFNNTELEKKVFTLKSTTEAIRCRDEILSRLEAAANSTSAEERKRLLSFVVIGGGPTGVEIAGALGEVKRFVINREFSELSPDDMSVTIVEGTDRLLRTMSERSSAKAKEYLERLMVDVELNKLMSDYDEHTVKLNDGSELEAGMVIWTAGITASPFGERGGTARRGPGNRIVVDSFNRAEGLDNVYAIGDISICQSEAWPNGCPQLAQVAIQQARLLARQLNNGSFDKEFEYNDMGTMATVGRNLAVVEIGRLKFGGRLAWLTWMGIHLISLLGARNKLTVLINWLWAYFTFNSSLRLMFRLPKYPLRGVKHPE